jgi:glycosyltransferase involved in cell wall biosynthesis
MMISVIIPAYNEEKYLAATLRSVAQALSTAACPSELIVVDNDSVDATKRIAEDFGAQVFPEKEHNISRVRNTGAKIACGEVLVFVDADTLIPEALVHEIALVMKDEKCFGGAVAVTYEKPARSWIRFYLLGWKLWGKVFKLRQGATQFCRREVFLELTGYDESIYIGEDVEFAWRLAKLARRRQAFTFFIEHLKVKTSARRFDKMNWWKTIWLTNPLLILLAWKRKRLWKDWYEKAVR